MLQATVSHERVKLQVFSLRSMASGGAFHRAYRHATQQTFLEAHELAFRYFGGAVERLMVGDAAMKRGPWCSTCPWQSRCWFGDAADEEPSF